MLSLLSTRSQFFDQIVGKDSYLLRTLFGWDTDIVQVLNRY
jgi:hypothetical protein